MLTACQPTTTSARIVLAGPFWDDPAQAGADLTREGAVLVPHGPVEITVVATPPGLDLPQRRLAVDPGHAQRSPSPERAALAPSLRTVCVAGPLPRQRDRFARP